MIFRLSLSGRARGFRRIMFFPAQRPPSRIHRFLSPQLRQSAVGLRCDQAALPLVIRRSWSNAASSLGVGRSSACGPPGLRWGLRFHAEIFGRICGTWASAGRSFALVSHKGGFTVTIRRGLDEGLAKSSDFFPQTSSDLPQAVYQG